MRAKTSQYWGVGYSDPDRRKLHDRFAHRSIAKPWHIHVTTPVKVYKKTFATEREAAIYADRINIEHRLGKPLNILKPKA